MVAVRGVLFVVADISIAVSCFLCASVSFCSRLISSIVAVVELVAMALAEVSGISPRLVVSLILSPMVLSS